jgi:BlaI family penicillinase repressor
MKTASEVPKPTESELEILSILWEKNEASVREVHQLLNFYKKTGYTTTLKLMQLMFFKGLISRKEVGRKHIYWSVIDRQALSRVLTDRLIGYLHNGSPVQLALDAINSTYYNNSHEELIQLAEKVSLLIAGKKAQ